MRSLVGLVYLIISLNALARESLVVIYDSGDTLPLQPYGLERAPQQKAINGISAPSLPFSLPITTPSMKPGKVIATPKALRYLQRPLFLMGSDQHSRDWLAAKREQLVELGAVGLLVEAKDQAAVEDVLAIAKGLRLVPASAEDFASQLGLSHYPILLSKKGWEQ